MVYAEVIAQLQDAAGRGQDQGRSASPTPTSRRSRSPSQVLGEGGLASVQNEFSPRFRCSEDELEYCGERGIAFLPWSPLGGTGGGGRKVGERFAAFGEIARGPRRQPAAGGAGLGAVAERARDPHPRRAATGVDHRLGQGGRPAAQRRGAGALQRHRREPMSAADADVIIVGGGHNGLVAAAYLARAGRRVTVLEARDHARRGGGRAPRSSPAWTPGCPGSPTWSRCCPQMIIDDLGLDLELRSRRGRGPTPRSATGSGAAGCRVLASRSRT